MSEDETPDEPIRQLKAGDRLWFWLDDPPSDFEAELANILTDFSKSEPGESHNGVFHVRMFSWRGDASFTPDFLKTCLPSSIELPFPRMINFFHVNGERELSIPISTLSFSRDAQAGSVHIHARKYQFMNQTLMILAAHQVDHDREGSTLAGSFDALGFVSLASGQILQGKPLFSAYFCTTRKKFVISTLRIVADSSLNCAPLQFAGNSASGFDARDDRTHAALWFAGRAFSSSDDASKLICYVTALEILTSDNYENFLRRLYRKDRQLQEFVLEKVKCLKNLRREVVHLGHRASFPADLERYTQAVIIDVIRQNHNNTSDEFAAQRLRMIEQAKSASGIS